MREPRVVVIIRKDEDDEPPREFKSLRELMEFMQRPGPAARTIQFNYSADKGISDVILSKIHKPLIKCKVDLTPTTINGVPFREAVKGIATAKAKLLSYALLTQEQRKAIEEVWIPEVKTARSPSACTIVARNMRPVVTFLNDEFGQLEKESADLVLSIVKGWFPEFPEVQSIELSTFLDALKPSRISGDFQF